MIDGLPYKIFKHLKTTHPSAMVLVTDDDLTSIRAQVHKNHRKYIESLFKDKGIEILRWQHDYDSLNTITPRLGVVHLANDSEIVPGIEVWVLLGHNARYIEEVKLTTEG